MDWTGWGLQADGLEHICKMRGRRAPEMAAGCLHDLFEQLWTVKFDAFKLDVVAELEPSEVATMMLDLAHAKASISSTLLIKCAHWSALPWKLCALAHHDETISRLCAQQCIQAFDAIPPDPKLHHPLTWNILEPGSCLRVELERYAHGEVMSRDGALRQQVCALAFVPVVERLIERGPHLRYSLRYRLASCVNGLRSLLGQICRHVWEGELLLARQPVDPVDPDDPVDLSCGSPSM